MIDTEHTHTREQQKLGKNSWAFMDGQIVSRESVTRHVLGADEKAGFHQRDIIPMISIKKNVPT